jgi:gamma-glutamyltranspeptidase/glutathione hydrolase
MRRVAIASGSDISAHAGAAIADAGGNAVDAAIAAMITAMCTDPGVIAPGSGGFLVIGGGDVEPIVIDAYNEMPGRSAPADAWGSGTPVFMKYGGATRTIVGYGSVATPGMFAGLELASRRHGVLPWHELFAPAIDAAERGFPLSQASADYLAYAHDVVFGWDPASYEALHHADGSHYREGDTVSIPHLADSLRALAEQGVETLYGGDLGRRITTAVAEHGGLLGLDDLAAYRPVVRRPVTCELGGWQVNTNPPPALGGTTMAAMAALAAGLGFDGWAEDGVEVLVRAQRAVLDYRGTLPHTPDDAETRLIELLDAARVGDFSRLNGSPSTTHTSTVDTDGLACAVTVSAGYCSGAMPAGTGFLLNNCLGEMELHPAGYHGLEPGERLVSNMAPSVVLRRGSALAIGSPGASRITTAVGTVLLNFLVLGMSLSDAIEHPRLHVEVFEGTPTVAYEPGIPVPAIDGHEPRRFPDLSMYFGGVQAAITDEMAGLFAVADPRRTGGVARGG